MLLVCLQRVCTSCSAVSASVTSVQMVCYVSTSMLVCVSPVIVNMSVCF